MSKTTQFNRCKEAFSNFSWADLHNAEKKDKEYEKDMAEIEKWRKSHDSNNDVTINTSLAYEQYKTENDKFSGEGYEHRDFRNRRKASYLTAMLDYNPEKNEEKEEKN